MYFLGIDSGGTKTAFVVMDNDGNIKLKLIKGTGHHAQIGFDGVENLHRETLEEIYNTLNITKEQIDYIFMGIPGYGEVKEDNLKLEEILHKVYGSINYKIGNDVETGWAGSLACKPGINVVCGTGAIAIGVDSNFNTARSSGWGPFIGDEGSAYWIGKKGLEVFSKQSDGRYDKTKFYEIFRERLNLEYDFQVIDLVHNKLKLNRTEIAKFSMIVSEIAQTGDRDAIRIFNEVAEEIYLMVKSIIKQLQLKGKLNMSYVGGVFNAGDLILEPLRKRFEEKNYNIEIIPPVLEAWEGATLYAYQLAGNEITQEIIDNIKSNR